MIEDNIDDIEWALRKAIDLLEEFFPTYYEDPTISEIIDIYKANFE